MADAYDAVAYPGNAFADMHPDRFATIAHLLGLPAFRPETCRVLELGCGDGANLVSLACALPGATFTGLDRAEAAIGRGRATAAALGLGNITLEAADLLDVPAAYGEFDVIIAHGLFSWVPEPVRRKALEICGGSLAANGIVFVSYLTLPGNHERDVYREVMRFHVRGNADPAERVRQARAVLGLLAEAGLASPERRALTASMQDEVSRVDDGVLYHDLLAEINYACLFADFVRMAGDAGLTFLSEAEYAAGFLPLEDPPAPVRATLERLAGDVLLHEQYADFLRCRGFRQTLLCRTSARVARPASPERLRTLRIAARVATDDGTVDLRPDVDVRFASRGAALTVRAAAEKAALAVLGAVWPATLPFEALAERVRETSGVEPDAGELAAFLLRCYERGVIELWTAEPRHALEAGARPEASPLARLQLAEGRRMLANLRNETVELQDDFGLAVLGLLDGTRDRGQIVDVLARAVLDGGSTMEADGRPVTDPAEVRALLTERLEDALAELAGSALLSV